jgi:tripartite-type tricarboxylate transporter receptor subunit TctC
MDRRKSLSVIAIAAAVVAVGVAGPAIAQTFPDKPIKILVGVPAGAGPDVEARQFAAQLSLELGQPVVVDNKPGFSQMLAIEALSKAPADGYTLALVQPSNMAANPRLYDRPLYNIEKDFAPISLLGEHPWVLYVNSNVQVKNLAEFIALAKSKPGKITYASTGVGSFQHLTGEWLQKITGTSLTHVPYGATGWQTDLLAGNVDAVLFPLITMTDHVKSGKLRALAISGNQRSSLLPDVPTFTESNYPEYVVRAWFGLMAPAGLPAPVLTRLNAASVKAVQSQAFREFFAKNGASTVGSTPTELGSYLKSEQTRWRTVITEANIKLD